MSMDNPQDFLKKRMAERGFAGRIFGLERWLRSARVNRPLSDSVTVVALCRPGRKCAVLDALARDDIPFGGILVQLGGEMAESSADVHLLLDEATPVATARNLAAAIAGQGIIVFLEGDATPCANFLRAYLDVFEKFPRTIACRGRISVPYLDVPAAVTGSFALPDDIELWPVDLEENMAVRSDDFWAMGGFDEALEAGYGALDFSIRLFGKKPDFQAQRHVPQASMEWRDDHAEGLPFAAYLFDRHRSWLELNNSLKRYLSLYADFWRQNAAAGLPARGDANV